MTELVEHRHITEAPDSIEIGTPAKGGAIKVYGNLNDLEGFKTKIKNAAELKRFAQTEIGF